MEVDAPPVKAPGSRPHRRRMTGVYLCPERSASVNTTKKAKAWKPIKDPLAKRSPLPPNSMENGFRRAIRQQLVEASEKDDIKVIEDCIRAFEKNRLEDKGDLTRANEKIELLYLRKSLFDAIHRRRVDQLDKAIAEVTDSRFRCDLDPFPLRKAKKLREELSSLNSFSQPVSLLDQRTISEMRTYGKIPHVVKNTMIAAFLMLGENIEDLKDWDYIRSVLGRTGTAAVRFKMENFNPTKVQIEIAKKAESYLKSVHIDTARQASIGSAAFFIWTKKAIAKVKGDTVCTTMSESDIKQADVSSSSGSGGSLANDQTY